MKVIVHLRAEVYDWSESQFSRIHAFLKKSKLEIQEMIKNETGEKWDYPDCTGKGGTTTTGNTARRILYDEKLRMLIISMVPERFQDIVREIGQKLAVILRVFCSGRKVVVTKYRGLCTSLYLSYLEQFPWVVITPSAHKLLAHSWELMENNDECGLKNFDESGLEANNKVLRGIRTKLARKTSQDDNLNYTINRLWLGSVLK